MFPTLFLLTGSMVAPTTYQITLDGRRMPTAHGPDAIFLKYKFDPVPMDGVGRGWVDRTDVEELRKQVEERRRQPK